MDEFRIIFLTDGLRTMTEIVGEAAHAIKNPVRGNAQNCTCYSFASCMAKKHCICKGALVDGNKYETFHVETFGVGVVGTLATPAALDAGCRICFPARVGRTPHIYIQYLN